MNRYGHRSLWVAGHCSILLCVFSFRTKQLFFVTVRLLVSGNNFAQVDIFRFSSERVINSEFSASAQLGRQIENTKVFEFPVSGKLEWVGGKLRPLIVSEFSAGGKLGWLDGQLGSLKESEFSKAGNSKFGKLEVRETRSGKLEAGNSTFTHLQLNGPLSS